ncbi:unnamed protein product [Trichobilharzia regenti]|nr:unnamed protein product [Trichobilharzia regenti]
MSASSSSSKLPSAPQKASSTPTVTPMTAAAAVVVVAPSTNNTISSLNHENYSLSSFQSNPSSLGEYFDKENDTTDDSLSLLADEFSRSTTSSANTDH